MKPLHTSSQVTASDSLMVVRVVEISTPDGPVRRIVVEVNAEMDTTEARRLIADLQHAVALAEEQSAVSEDQPKPRVWRDETGSLWCDADPEPLIVLIECDGSPTTNPTRVTRSGVERAWGPLVEVLADSEQVRHG